MSEEKSQPYRERVRIERVEQGIVREERRGRDRRARRVDRDEAPLSRDQNRRYKGSQSYRKILYKKQSSLSRDLP